MSYYVNSLYDQESLFDNIAIITKIINNIYLFKTTVNISNENISICFENELNRPEYYLNIDTNLKIRSDNNTYYYIKNEISFEIKRVDYDKGYHTYSLIFNK